jgi:hypothetical protein
MLWVLRRVAVLAFISSQPEMSLFEIGLREIVYWKGAVWDLKIDLDLRSSDCGTKMPKYSIRPNGTATGDSLVNPMWA